MERKPCRLATVARLVLLVSIPHWASSQSASLGAAAGTGVLALPSAPAREALLVLPDGSVAKPSRPPSLELHSEVLRDSEQVGDILGRHGLADDANTREMLKSLNPKHDFSKGTLAAGSRIDIFTVVPVIGSQSLTAPKYTFDTSNLAQYAFYAQATRASELSAEASRLPPSAFADPSLARVHVQSTNDIRQAAQTLESHADNLSHLDYAVAQYQVEYASLQAARLNLKVTAVGCCAPIGGVLGGVFGQGNVGGAVVGSGKLSDFEVRAAAQSARTATQMSERVASGKSPSEWRTVRVNVYEGNTMEHVHALQVYVLPSGALENPGLWKRSQLESFLTDFSFTNEASPASQPVPTDFDPRVCVGPKNAVSGMARLIAEGKLTTCRRPPAMQSASAQVEITFRAPDDIAKP